MSVEWEAPENADGLVIKLLNEEGKVIFLSYTLIATADEYDVNPSSGNWRVRQIPRFKSQNK